MLRTTSSSTSWITKEYTFPCDGTMFIECYQSSGGNIPIYAQGFLNDSQVYSNNGASHAIRTSIPGKKDDVAKISYAITNSAYEVFVFAVFIPD